MYIFVPTNIHVLSIRRADFSAFQHDAGKGGLEKPFASINAKRIITGPNTSISTAKSFFSARKLPRVIVQAPPGSSVNRPLVVGVTKPSKPEKPKKDKKSKK